MDTEYICYKIINTVNNKSYIGQTRLGIKNRWKRHLGAAFWNLSNDDNVHVLHLAIRKYGKDAFVIEQLAATNSSKEIDAIECQMIKEHNTFYENHQGYNMTLGGDGTSGYIFTDEVREKMSKAQLGTKRGPRSEETKRKISLANKGRKPSLYANQRRSELGTGVPRPQEVKDKIRQTLTGRKRPPEVIAKIKATKRRKKELKCPT